MKYYPWDYFQTWEPHKMHLEKQDILYASLYGQVDDLCMGIELVERQIKEIMTNTKNYVNAVNNLKGDK
jgi:hypothetical protein